MRKTLFIVYAYIFSRKIFYKMHKLFFLLSLKGMGILNYESNFISGENKFIKMLFQKINVVTVFDVGANIGNYSEEILNKANKKNINIYSFEPNPFTYNELENRFNTNSNINCFNYSLSDHIGEGVLYDYSNRSNDGSHASLYQGVIKDIHKKEVQEIEIKHTTLDEFIKKENIKEIDLLKIDTEGHELAVIKGASEAIKNNKIKMIQLEFNEMNVFSGVFLQNFISELENYKLYRLLPNSLAPIKDSTRVVYKEIFAYQNILAVRKDVEFKY